MRGGVSGLRRFRLRGVRPAKSHSHFNAAAFALELELKHARRAELPGPKNGAIKELIALKWV